jgi:hypothetical protein
MESHFGHAVLESKEAGMLAATVETVLNFGAAAPKSFLTPICPMIACLPMFNHLEFCPAFHVVAFELT